MNLKQRVKFNIYLLKNLTPKSKNYRDYFRESVNNDPNLERYFLDKRNITGLEYKRDKQGEIYVLKKQTNAADWVNQLNKISRGKIQGQDRTNDKGILFIECCHRVLAVSFGRGISMIEDEYIEKNFGLKVAQNLLEIDKLGKINSLMLGDSHYNLRKHSNSTLPVNRLTSVEDISIVNSINGETEEGFNIGGGDSISFSGKINLNTELMQILNNFMTAFNNANSSPLKLESNLSPITDKTEITMLNEELAEKILKMKKQFKSKKELNGKILRNIEMVPRPVFELDPLMFKGYAIKGIGSIELLERLDKTLYFEKLSRYLLRKNIDDYDSLIKKLKEHSIDALYDNETEVHIGKVYEVISYEVRRKSKTYILTRGSWYCLDEDFFQSLKDEIDNIPEHQTNVDFGQFDKTHTQYSGQTLEQREELYNADICNKHSDIDNFDQKFYSIDTQTRTKYGIGSFKIEPCDLYFKENDIYKFVHVKRFKGPSDISHLLVQAHASATLLVNREDFLNHINSSITKSSILNPPVRTNDVEVVLALIVKPAKYNKQYSSLFPVLSMLSIVNSIRSIKMLGFNCSIQLIKDVYVK